MQIAQETTESERKKLTIGGAERFVREGGATVLDTTVYRQLLTKAQFLKMDGQDHGLGMPRERESFKYTMRGLNYLHVLTGMRAIMQVTKQSFGVLADSDRSAELLLPDLEEMLKRLEQREGQANVIVVNGDSGVFADLQERYAKVLQVVRGRADKPFQQYTVADDKYLLEVEPHEPLQSDDFTSDVNGKLYINYPSIAELKQSIFRDLLKKLAAA